MEERSASPGSPLRNPRSAICNLSRSLTQSMITKYQCGHCFYDWHCTGKDARIMPPARSESGLLARTSHRFLFVADCSCRLKRDAKINFLSITDAALHSAGVVRRRANFSAAHLKWIVMLRAPHPGGRKTRTDFETFCCRYAQHRFSQICLELIENRLANSRRNAASDAFNDAANRVALAANVLDERDHLFRRRGIRAANNILLDVCSFHRGTINFRSDFVNLRDVGDNFEFRIQRR